MSLNPVVGEILNLVAKKKKDLTVAESAYVAWVSTRFDASRRGKKELKCSRDKNARHEPAVGRGERSLLCDPGSELLLGGRRNKKGENSKWDGKVKITKNTRGTKYLPYDYHSSVCTRPPSPR